MFKVFQKWRRDEEAVASLEFALLVIPFLTLCMAIIEMALMFSSASMLEFATGNAARLVRTGQIQQATNDAAAQEQMFRDAFCRFAGIFIVCEEVDIESVVMAGFDNFDDFAPEFNEDGGLVPGGFAVGGVSSVMLIRVGYRHTLMTPFVNLLLSQNGSGTRYFTSTIVLQTEPYEFTAEL